jgi:2-haloacid dehalogenase
MISKPASPSDQRPAPAGIKALFFDVFGTLVDWRRGVAREAESILRPLGFHLDWQAFAIAWREQYQPGMEQVRCGAIPYAKLDVLHLRMLQRILPSFALEKIPLPVQDQLTLAWHRLDAWQDVPAALNRLRRHYRLAPVSNGNIALMSDLARRNQFTWDAILGADLARNYKPRPEVYRAAVDAFNLEPGQCMMCAAHSSDLKAASENGLRTAFIARPDEEPGISEESPTIPVDYSTRSVDELATRLGV